MTTFSKTMYMVFCLVNATPFALLSQQSFEPEVTVKAVTSDSLPSAEKSLMQRIFSAQTGYAAGAVALTPAIFLGADGLLGLSLFSVSAVWPDMLLFGWLGLGYALMYCVDKAFFDLDMEVVMQALYLGQLHPAAYAAMAVVTGAGAFAGGVLGMFFAAFAVAGLAPFSIVAIPIAAAAVACMGAAYVLANMAFYSVKKVVKSLFGERQNKTPKVSKRKLRQARKLQREALSVA